MKNNILYNNETVIVFAFRIKADKDSSLIEKQILNVAPFLSCRYGFSCISVNVDVGYNELDFIKGNKTIRVQFNKADRLVVRCDKKNNFFAHLQE